MKKLTALALVLLMLCTALPTLAEEAAVSPMVRMGGSFGLAIDAKGQVWGWGDNRSAQLGLEQRKIIGTPVLVATGLSGKDILDIQCGNENTLFLMKDGAVYTAGTNDNGRQGVAGIKYQTTVPVQIPELKNIVQVSCGFGHCLALDSEGHVWGWGRNNVGQVGNGTRTDVKAPVMLPLENIREISCGGKYSMAIDHSGVVWGWGESDYSQLGGKKIARQMEPMVVNTGDIKIKQLVCGSDTAYFLDEDGVVWALGRNDYWQLGTDDVSQSAAEPVKAEFPEGVKIARIIAYNAHTMALSEDGQAWVWGSTYNGQLGLGKRVRNSLPTLCVDGGVVDGSVGSLVCCVMKEDGQVLLTGYNKYAQIGTLYKRKNMIVDWTDNGLNLQQGVLVTE